MASGAGHDAAVFAGQGIPTAMLFVPNQNGSHSPDEAIDLGDFAAGVKVLGEVAGHLAAASREGDIGGPPPAAY